MPHRGSSALARVYAGLALAGAVVPYVLFVPWLARHGVDLSLFARALFAEPPAAIFSLDALMASAVFLLFAEIEGRRWALPRRWLPALLLVVFGLSCALPAFLALRERRLSPDASVS